MNYQANVKIAYHTANVVVLFKTPNNMKMVIGNFKNCNIHFHLCQRFHDYLVLYKFLENK